MLPTHVAYVGTIGNKNLSCPTDMIFLVILALISSTYGRISVMYAHDKSTDSVAEQCLNEMYPNAKIVDFQETDEPCIIFCVLKKFGIINANGNISLDAYK